MHRFGGFLLVACLFGCAAACSADVGAAPPPGKEVVVTTAPPTIALPTTALPPSSIPASTTSWSYSTPAPVTAACPALGIDDARRIFGYSARDSIKVKDGDAGHDEEGEGYDCKYTRNGSVALELQVFVWHREYTEGVLAETVDGMVENDYRTKKPVPDVGVKAILCTKPGQPGRIVSGKLTGGEMRVLNFRTMRPVPESALIEVAKVVLSHL